MIGSPISRSLRLVIIVAPSFAPASNPPTQRVRFFARHLPQFGWTPTVLTVDPRYYEEPLDPDIESLLPKGLDVVRTGAWPASTTRRFGIGDLGIRAYTHLDRALRSLCESRRPDLIFIPGPPWHTFRLGPAMRTAFGIPYVLDYIDPWVNSIGADGRWWTKAFWFRQMAIALEPRAVRDAAHLIAVSTGTTNSVRASYPDVPAERCSEVPYGVEPSDFSALRGRPARQAWWDASDGNFHMSYVGAMLPRGYDTLRALFAGVSKLRREQPQLGDRIRIHFVGTTYDPSSPLPLVLPIARDMGLGDVVTEHPARVPYLDALNILCTSDANLALGSTEAHYTASKVFPMILARRPLLAIFHAASPTCDVVRQSHAGDLITYDDSHPAGGRVDAIAASLARIIAGEGYDPSQIDADVLGQYTAEAMTARLAAVFDGVVAGQPRTADEHAGA